MNRAASSIGLVVQGGVEDWGAGFDGGSCSRNRFVRSDTAVALFRHAPAVDLGKLRDDLDRVASQDLSPRG